MENAIVIKGRLVGPKNVELDEPVTSPSGDVEVIVRTGADSASQQVESVFDFLRRLPPGMQGREEIDRRLREEREAWGNGA
ncbi:MAG: hypothetical protein ABSH08_00335 [Tepidisphaeraceae bacterium]|jgi:hypothetical protein